MLTESCLLPCVHHRSRCAAVGLGTLQQALAVRTQSSCANLLETPRRTELKAAQVWEAVGVLTCANPQVQVWYKAAQGCASTLLCDNMSTKCCSCVLRHGIVPGVR